MIILSELGGVLVGTADKKHLTHLFLQAHFSDHFVELVNGGLGRLLCRGHGGLCGRNGGGDLGRGALCAAGGESEQQRKRQ